ncbi:MAG: hypothetical protein ABFE13_01745 [Phycisphaerales bacterium]
MMPKTIRHVLKAAEVTLDDPVQLAIDPAATTGCCGPKSAPAGPSARITQTHPEYALIEVTCACGRTTQVRCDYVAASPSDVRQEPTPE